MRLLASAILALCVQSVCAQSILKDPKELSVLLNEVVVTGTGTEHYLKEQIPTIKMIRPQASYLIFLDYFINFFPIYRSSFHHVHSCT